MKLLHVFYKDVEFILPLRRKFGIVTAHKDFEISGTNSLSLVVRAGTEMFNLLVVDVNRELQAQADSLLQQGLLPVIIDDNLYGLTPKQVAENCW